jgi:all-trans-8'-apo-beta-carotenal 15,15'-oxygenase
MTAITSRSTTWAKAIAKPAAEFPLTSLTVMEGAIPEGLEGSLYRNGPGRLMRGGASVGHWFDGDGAILAVHFAAGQARATYRYVQTARYLVEEKADRLIYGNYGMVAPGPWWQRWGKASKNVANTSVLALDDRLLALWEGGLPHGLDLETLATTGLDNLPGLEQRLAYSAHPKRDPSTGDVYNFGVAYGKDATLHLYRHDRRGQLLGKNQIKLPGLSMIHDFVMAGDYLIFCVPPLRVNPLPLVLNLKCFSDAIQWQPEVGTTLLVFDRNNLNLVSRNVTEPWYQWHFGNGYGDRDGNLVFDLVRYSDFTTNQFLKEVASGKTETVARGQFYQMRLNPQTGAILSTDRLFERTAEFPTVSPLQVSQEAPYTYLSVRHDEAKVSEDLLGTIARFDHESQTLTIADLGAHAYASEPLFIPDRKNLASGWVITVVFDGERECSEVWVFESDRLDERPIVRLALPSVVPMGFHGTWRPMQSTQSY